MKSFYEMLELLEQPMLANPGMVKPATQPAQNLNPQQNPNQTPNPQQNLSAKQNPNAQQNQNAGADPEETNKLKQLLGKSYEQFVSELKGNVNDPKFLNFLKAGLQDGSIPQDDMVKFSTINASCAQLIPTQNEIDVDKSLSYPLQKENPQTILSYLNGGVFAPGGPIVTCGGGKYIIDGHHRWSQLYCMNPKAQIKAIDMTAFSDPVTALKIVQLSIAATQGTIKVQAVQGSNLLNMNEQQIKDYVAKSISDNAKQAFAQVAQGQDPVVYAQQYIWNNVASMQQSNQPISGASKRDFMPQTDSGGEFAKQLQQGTVNWNQNSSTKYDEPTINEMRILSGLLQS